VDARPGRAHAFTARAEFRRRDRNAPWILAGVLVGGEFWPARPGVERIRQRLPDAGLLGWADLPSPLIAPDAESAAAAALEVAAAAWPARAGRPVPWASGTRAGR
jgi:hypothetical protein